MKTIIINSQAVPNESVPQEMLDVLSMALTVTLPVDVTQAIEELGKCSRDCNLCVGVGYNSLWATYLSQNNNIPCILINPQIDVSDYLSRQVGKENSNITARQVVDYVKLEQMVMLDKPTEHTNVVYTEPAAQSTVDYFANSLEIYTGIDASTTNEHLLQLIGNLTDNSHNAIINT